MIIENHREISAALSSNSSSLGPKLKTDLMRIIQDRRAAANSNKSTNQHLSNYHHNHRRLSNSASPSEIMSLSSSSNAHRQHHHRHHHRQQHHQHGYGLDAAKSWGGISGLFSNSLEKKIIKS